MKTNFKKRLSKHLLEEGFLFQSDPSIIDRRLQKLMGPKRFRMYCNSYAAAQRGESGRAEIYRSVQTKEEAHLLFSHQTETIVAVDEWLGTKISEMARPPSQIADMGCATGTFCNWLKSELPDANVVGFEREKNLADIAIDNSKGTTFHRWDYSSGQKSPMADFDLLLTGLGIDFVAVDPNVPLGSTSRRDLPDYKACHQQITPVLESWRSISREDAKLFAVLRIPNATLFMAVVDAAAGVGWSIQLDECSWINTSYGQRFPGLVFSATAAPSGSLNEDVMVGHWIADQIRRLGATKITDDAARELYKHISPKTILNTKDVSYDDGHVRRWDLVSCGSFSIEYSEATTGFAELTFLPLQGVGSAATCEPSESEPSHA
jgi:hypothetical protein